MEIFGARFSEKDLESAFSKEEIVDLLCRGEKKEAISDFIKKLREIDTKYRFVYHNQEYLNTEIYYIGIPYRKGNPEETFKHFEKTVESTLSKLLKKKITCSQYSIDNE